MADEKHEQLCEFTSDLAASPLLPPVMEALRSEPKDEAFLDGLRAEYPNTQFTYSRGGNCVIAFPFKIGKTRRDLSRYAAIHPGRLTQLDVNVPVGTAKE